MTPGGIDIFILRGPSLEAIQKALAAACGLAADDIIGPGESIMDKLNFLQRPLRATIFKLSAGDFGYKVDVAGLTPRDYLALARNVEGALGHGVVVPDESKPDPFSSILLHRNEPDILGYIQDAEPDGQCSHINGTKGS
jgi:hypothetical protein